MPVVNRHQFAGQMSSVVVKLLGGRLVRSNESLYIVAGVATEAMCFTCATDSGRVQARQWAPRPGAVSNVAVPAMCRGNRPVRRHPGLRYLSAEPFCHRLATYCSLGCREPLPG